MRPLTVPDAENVILALQDEIRRSDESRYDHRLHGLLLVAQGMTAPEVSRMLGDSPRTVQYWLRRFEEEGLSGLPRATAPAALDVSPRLRCTRSKPPYESDPRMLGSRALSGTARPSPPTSNDSSRSIWECASVSASSVSSAS